MYKSKIVTTLLAAACALFSLQVIADPVPVEQFANFETAHVHPLDLTPDGSTLLAVNTANNTLEVFNVGAQGVLTASASIPVGHDPVTVRARSNTEVWVANLISDTISIVDLDMGAVVRTLQTENEPSDIVFAGLPQRAFVSVAERESVQVFDLANLNAGPDEVLLIGEQPRALAVSPDGNTVYAAFFESGNETTVIPGNDFIAAGGLRSPGSGTTIVDNDVRNPQGPYGGAVPVPNAGNNFSPALNPTLPPKTDTQSLVVKKQPNGTWIDDNNGDWTSIVTGGQGMRQSGWDLKDRDVAMIDTSNLGVTYQRNLGNILMAMSTHPVSGNVYVVGTDANNHVRFEPNLNGTFMRHNLSSFAGGGGTPTITDLNSHLNYSSPSVTNPEKALSVGDPRAIEWLDDGSAAFVSSMGSNTVIKITANGGRIGSPIPVGEGPTGVVVDNNRNTVYVLNKFDASISTLDVASGAALGETFFFDPTPQVIKTGRPHLYNTSTGSGNGTISCASCHVDGKWDRLGWDLGNPAGEMETVNGTDFHPLKGLKTTQTLMDIISTGLPLHWRGDKAEFRDFHLAFENLKGREPLSEQAMIEFEEFLSTTYHPPNPYRQATWDNTLLDDNLIRGFGTNFQNFNLEGGGAGAIGAWHEACGGCHQNETGKGPPGTKNFRDSQYEGNENIAPDLRMFYRKLGFYYDTADSTTGFGIFSDGIGRTTEAPRTGYWFDYHGVLFGFAGGGPTDVQYSSAPIQPPHPAQNSHYRVGEQATINGGIGSRNSVTSLRNAFDNPNSLPFLSQQNLGLVVHGIYQGEQRGFVYTGGGNYRSDRTNEIMTEAQLLTAAETNNNEPLTWMLVHPHVAERLGVDRDADGIVNQDDLNDADNDGVEDALDAFPNDPSESIDSDGDGIGNNADTDDDNDGVPDSSDALPLNAAESVDTDADGIGNNADLDDDGDGVVDTDDEFPLDFTESRDSDGDSLGDNADNDDDNDGIATLAEAGGREFQIQTDGLLAGSLGNTATSLVDLTGSGALVGQLVAISDFTAQGNLRTSADGIIYTINDGEYVSSLVRTGSNRCSYRSVFPEINASVRVIDIGGGIPGIKVDAQGSTDTTTTCSGPQYQFQISGTSALVPDVDADGIPNEFDRDSDNDSIADVIEAGLTDADGDYQVNSLQQQGVVTDLPDSDNDGIADIFDRESSNPLNNGTAFDIGTTPFAAFDTNGDGMVNANDTNGGTDNNQNGVDDRFESGAPVAPPPPVNPEPVSPTDTLSNGGISIALDGSTGDWASASGFAADPADVDGSGNTLDLAQAFLAHDENNLYVRYDSHSPDNMLLTWGYSVQIDTDGNSATGFRGFGNELPIGVDYMIEGATLHRYTGTGNDFSWSDSQQVSQAIGGRSIELSIPRARLNNPTVVTLFFHANNAAVGGNALDYYPDAASNTSAASGSRAFAYSLTGDTTPVTPPITPTPVSSVTNPLTIVANGDLSDWATAASFGLDADDVSGANNVLDWAEAWVAHDATNFYFAWQNHDSALLSWGNGIMLDTDRSSATGFRGFSRELPTGVDYLIEADTVHRYTGSGTDWSWTTAGTPSPIVSGRTTELVVPRAVLGNTNAFDVFYVANNAAVGGEQRDYYPDAARNTAAPSESRYFFYSTTGVTTPPTSDRSFTLDGSLNEWLPSDVIGGQDANDMTPPDTIDWRNLRLATAGEIIYLAYESYDPVLLNWGYGVLIDTDGSMGTGFRGFGNELAIGAEFMLEGGSLYSYTGATQNDWSWTIAADIQSAVSGNAAEFALPKSVLGNPAALQIRLRGNNGASGGSGIDLHPDNGAVNWTVPLVQLDVPQNGTFLQLRRLFAREGTPAAGLSNQNANTQQSGGGGTLGWLAILMLTLSQLLRKFKFSRSGKLSSRVFVITLIPLVLLIQACDSGAVGDRQPTVGSVVGSGSTDTGAGNTNDTNASGNLDITPSQQNSLPYNNPSFDAEVDAEETQSIALTPRANASFIRVVRTLLSADQMVPAVASAATGEMALKVNTRTGELTGNIQHSVVGASQATLSVGAVGRAGLPIVQLGRQSGSLFTVPTGTFLNTDQLLALHNQELYMSVHSADFPNGELRGQLRTE